MSQPLIGASSAQSLSAASAPSKYESPRAKTALIVMISVLVTSAIFLSVILGVMHRAQPTIERAQLVLGRAEIIMDYPDRLLHGNVFHVATNFLQTNWLDLSRNVTKLSSALSTIFNPYPAYDRFNQIARTVSLISSVAAKVGWIKPNWDPKPIDGPSDDQGVVNLLSYFTEFAGEQANRKDVAELAQSCDALTAALLTVDWSGRYQWGKGRGYGDWDANNLKSTVQTVQDYCRQFAKVPPSLEDDSAAVDVVPEPTATPVAAADAN